MVSSMTSLFYDALEDKLEWNLEMCQKCNLIVELRNSYPYTSLMWMCVIYETLRFFVIFYQKTRPWIFIIIQLKDVPYKHVIICIELANDWTSSTFSNLKCNYYQPLFFEENTLVMYVFNKKWYKHHKNDITMLEFVGKWLVIHVRDVTVDY